MSYGPDISDLFRRASEYVHKRLRGAKPGDLPVEREVRSWHKADMARCLT
jgi:putative ABC transport system substrate-binding protein